MVMASVSKACNLMYSHILQPGVPEQKSHDSIV
jgi:hypothetical protein